MRIPYLPVAVAGVRGFCHSDVEVARLETLRRLARLAVRPAFRVLIDEFDVEGLEHREARFLAVVDLTTDLSQLTEKQRQMLPFLMEAGKIMDNCFWYEAYGPRKEFLESLTQSTVRKFVEINYGPWDRLDGNAPFVKGVGPKPLGANYYPADMTKAEFEAADLSGKDSLYTFLRRAESGKLKVFPYREQFKQPMHCQNTLMLKK